MWRNVVFGVCLVAVLLTASVAVGADSVMLVASTYSPGQNHTTYSYMLIIDASRECHVGDTFSLIGLAPVEAVGDPVYWHRWEVEALGNGSAVHWYCDTRPPADGHIFATFDVIVYGKKGVDFVEDQVTWQLDNSGPVVNGQVTGPVPIGGWTPTGYKGKITGIVYFDADQDAVYDSDELLLQGVDISVLDSSGNEVFTATTDENGAFEIDEVPEGTYLVKMVLADGETRYVVVTTGNADGQTVAIEGEEEEHVEFGLYLNTCVIADDIKDGTITGDGLSKGYWTHQVILAILCMLREQGGSICLPGGWRAIIGSGCDWNWGGGCDCDSHWRHRDRDHNCGCGNHHSRRRGRRRWCIVSPSDVAGFGRAFIDMACHRRHRDRDRSRCRPRPPRCPRPRLECPPREDVLGILAQVEGLWIVDPFQFADGDNGEPVGFMGLIEAARILTGYAELCGTTCDADDDSGDGCHCQCTASISMQCHHRDRDHHRRRCHPKPPRLIRPRLCWKARLARQLLAAEMNWVTERRSSLGRLEGWLLWYAEWAYNNECKARSTDAGKCLPTALDGLNNLGD